MDVSNYREVSAKDLQVMFNCSISTAKTRIATMRKHFNSKIITMKHVDEFLGFPSA